MTALSSFSSVSARRRFGAVRSAALLWLLYALFFVAGVAQAAIVPLLPRLSTRFGLGTTEAALLLALPGLATLAVSVPAGVAADRFGARRVSLAAGWLLCLSSVAQAVPSLAVLMAGRVAFGLAFGVVWTTGMAWLSALDDGSGGSTLGPSVTCSSVGIMAGPAIAGGLAQQAGLAAPFLVVAGVCAAVVAPLAVLGGGRRRAAKRSAVTGDVADADRAGGTADVAGADRAVGTADVAGADRAVGTVGAVRAVLRRPTVIAAAGALAVSGAVSGVSQLLISTGLHTAGLSTANIGLAFSASAVCYIAVSALTVRAGARARTLRFNAFATAILALALVPALLGAGAVGLVAALMVSAAPRAAVSTVGYALAAGAEDGDRSQDGLVFGLLNGAWAAATVLSPLVAGALAQRGGADAGYLGVIVPALCVAGWLVVRSRVGSGSPRVGVIRPRVTVHRVAGAGAAMGRAALRPRPLDHAARWRRAARPVSVGRAAGCPEWPDRSGRGEQVERTERAILRHAQNGAGAHAHAHAGVRSLR